MKTHTIDGPKAIIALIAVQVICTAFFLWDVVNDIRNAPPGSLFRSYLSIELLAALSLIFAVLFEIRYLRVLLHQKAHLEKQVSIAAGAFHDVMQAQFDDWNLTPAERDVVGFVIKGMSIVEIADLRGSAEGTIKSQLNAIYRKAGVPGRGALQGTLLDDLLSAPHQASAHRLGA